jgi:hypothetical protein
VSLGPIENKVIGAVSGAGGAVVVANFVLWVLGTYASAGAATAQPVVAFVNLSVAVLGAFAVGYVSRHTELPPAAPVEPAPATEVPPTVVV